MAAGCLALLLGGLVRAASAQATQGPLPDSGSGITRDIGSIAVIGHDGTNYSLKLPDGSPNYDARIAVAKRFYQTHGDYYDFIVTFTNFEFDTGFASAFHSYVGNSVTGIGKPVGNGAADFGSAGRLKGMVDMAAMSRYKDPDGPLSIRPGDPRFLSALDILAHEMGHQWLAQAKYRDSAGNISSDLLGKDGSHWSYLLDSDASTMYGSDWVETQPGRFTAERVRAGYSPLDLYLMGFVSKDQVPPFSLLHSPGADPTALPVAGAEIDATAETVTIEQVISAMGPRSPGSASSQKEFRLGFVFLTAPGTQPSDEDLQAVEAIRQFFSAHFFALTRGIGLADTSLTETPGGPTNAVPDLDLAKAWLLGRQEADGHLEDSASTALRDTAAAATALSSIGTEPVAAARALAWLGSATPANADFKARQVSSLASTASPSQLAQFRADLLAYVSESGGFGLFRGFASDPIDTALVLQALRLTQLSAGPVVDSAFSSLSASRLIGGGWPTVASADRSVAATAEVLLAIQAWEPLGRGGSLKADAIGGLIALQNTDGGFGEGGASSAYATALALSALTEAGAPSAQTQPAIAWLQSHQSQDGSWNGSVYETSRVLAALKGGLRPNLVVPPSSISMEPVLPDEGDIADVRATIRNVGRVPTGPTRAALFDGEPGTGAPIEVVEIPGIPAAGEFAAHFSYPTAGRPGNHDLFVVADFERAVDEVSEIDNAAPFAITVKGRLADLDVRPDAIGIDPEPVAVGEVGQVSVVVANKGQREAAPSVLLLTDGDPATGGTLIGQASIPTLAPGSAVTVHLAWTPAGPGVHAIHATSDASYLIRELDENNNTAVRLVEVLSEIPAQADLTLLNAGLDPAVLQRIPSVARYRVTVANLGRAAAASVVRVLDLAAPGVVLSEQPVALAGRSRVDLVLDVPIASLGSRHLVARVDPDGLVDEADETNNEVSATLIDSHATVDLVVASASVTPTTVVLGREVTVSLELKNEGTATAAFVPVVLLGPAGAELARVTVSLPAAGAATVSIPWKTTLTGDPLALTVRADPFNTLAELSEDNNQASLELSITPAPETNLAVQSGGISFSPNPLVEGQSAQLSASIMNTTAVAAGAFAVRFFLGDPQSGGRLVGEETMSGAAPGSSVVSTVTWPVVAAHGATGIFVVADADDTVAEYDETDNRAFRSLVALGYPDLALSAASVTLEPRYPRSGQSVRVRVNVTNVGGQPSTSTVLRLTEGEGAAVVVVATSPFDPLAVGEARVVEIDWTPANTGERLLTVAADAEGVMVEADEGNNTARVPALVQDANIYVSEAYFSPDGDGTRDTTTLAYRAGSPVSLGVFDHGGRRMRVLSASAPPEGTVTWDGRADTGLIVQDGAYLLEVRTEDGLVVSRATTVVDTNREELHASAGSTMLAARNVTCGIPYSLLSTLQGPVWTRAEDALLYVQSSNAEFETGLVRVALDGAYEYLFKGEEYNGESFASEVSPDGREVAISSYDGQVHILDLTNGSRRPFPASPGERIIWSPDGQRLSVGGRVTNRLGEPLFDLPTPEAFYQGFAIAWAWSPDGRHLANGNTIINSDGSDARTLFELPRTLDGGTSLIKGTEFRGDGKIVVTTCFDVGEGCQTDRTLVADPQTGEVTELTWLAEGRDPPPIVPRPLRWSRSGEELLFARQPSLSLPAISYVAGQDGGSRRTLFDADLYASSPRGTGALFWKYAGAGVCASEFAQFALTTLNNLAVSLDASRLPGNRGIAIKATVGDRNLAFYQLEYADASTPAGALLWRPVGPAYDSPVNDELLTVWVPPAPGSYAVRLTAEDRAGNTQSRTQLLSWERTPVIANLTQSLRLMSPTGDGVRDDVTFTYLVLEPTEVQVRILGPRVTSGSDGPLVRAFVLSHPTTGPASFLWNGRDELGVLVPDGLYTVFIADLPFSLKVDSTPPDIAWSYGPLQRTEGELRTTFSGHVVDDNLKVWSLAGPSNRTLFVPATKADGSPIFGPNGAAAVTRGPDGRAIDVVEVEKVERVHTGEAAVLIASDQAGNVSALTVAAVPRGLFLLAACQADANLDEGTCKRERKYPNSGGTVKLPLRTYFRLIETSGDGREGTVRFEHRLRGTATWMQTAPAFSLKMRDVKPHVQRFSEQALQNFWPVDLEAMGLTLGVDYEGRFVREGGGDGEALATDIFIFSACNPYVETVLTPIDPDEEGRTLKFDVSVAGDVGEPVANASLRVVDSEGTVLADQSFDVGSAVRIVLPPATCVADFSVTLKATGGRVYENQAPCQALRKVVQFECGSGGDAGAIQSFAFCSAKPDDVHFTSLSGTLSFELSQSVGVPLPILLQGPSRGSYTYTWDVTGRPEGTETLRAGRRGADGALGNPRPVETVIDRSAPGVFVLNPALEGDLLCPTTLEDGRRAGTFDLEVDDLGGQAEVCAAEVTTLSGPFAGATIPVTPLCTAASGKVAACGSQGTTPFLRVPANEPSSLPMSIEGLPKGDYGLSFTVADRVGNRTVASRRFSLLGSGMGVDTPNPALFSPNGDGLRDQTSVRVRVAQTAMVSVSVESVKDLVVGQAVAAGSSIDVPWDGRRADGSVVPDGKYTILVSSMDACNSVSTKKVIVEVDNTPPWVLIETPAEGSSVSVSAAVRGHADDLNFSTYQLLTMPAGGGFVAVGPPVAGAVTTGAAGLLGNWPLPSTPGVHLLKLLAFDRAQNRSETTVSVNVGPPGALVRLRVTPDLFSPNGDGRRESATVSYSLSASRRVSLEILSNAAGNVVRALQSSQDAATGDYAIAWDGRNGIGEVVPDGEYAVRLTASDPTGESPTEVQEARVRLDATPPVIQVTSPLAQAVVPGESEVGGSIEDPLLKDYALHAFSTLGGSSAALAHGSAAISQGVLASLAQLSDGSYSLLVTAEDAAENQRLHERPFVVDTTPPEALFANPAPNAVLPVTTAPVRILGTAADVNLVDYRLDFGRGPNPALFNPIGTGTASVHSDQLGSWNVASLPDGVYTLRLRARDRAGLETESRRSVTLDGTPPVAAILVPESGSRTNGRTPVQGTASDQNFEGWTLEGAPGAVGPASQWTELARGAEAVVAGLLSEWTLLPPDGAHSFRLTARDKAGHASAATTTVELDTRPPRPPVPVRIDIEARQASTADLRVVWLPSPDSDVSGYFIYRKDGTRLNNEPQPLFSYLDPAQSEGLKKYLLSAVDSASNESERVTISRLLDLSPPAVAITAPATGAVVSGDVAIHGIAFSSPDFKEYRLFVEPAGNPAQRVLIRRSALPVSNAALGRWLAVGAGSYLLTLQAEDLLGNQAETTSTLAVDTTPPLAVTLTSLQISPLSDSLTAAWTTSSSTDVLGYLLYRNGRLANIDALVLGDLRPYALAGLTYTSNDLPDGRHCYTVVAMDAAGNRSEPSNQLCADLDNRPPLAVISNPAPGHAFDSPLLVAATTPDTDIATVALQYRASGTPSWLALGAPDSQAPYQATLHAADLTEGPYDLRAVATDTGGRTDLNPEFITVQFKDVTPPPAPLALRVQVDGASAHLTWNAAPNAVHYRVYRDGESITADPVTGLTFDDSGLPIGRYQYAVTGLDDRDNESPRSNEAMATIYEPVLSKPPFPVVDSSFVDLLVSGLVSDGTLEISRNEAPMPSLAVNAGETVLPPAPLLMGPNLFKVRAIHQNGDRSLWSEESVVIRNEPPAAVSGLQATASGFSALVQWDPVVDPEVVGYEVSRDGEARATLEPITHAGEVTGTDVPYSWGFTNGAQFSFDQNLGTVWVPATDSPDPFVTLTLAEPAMISRVSLQFVKADQFYYLGSGVVADYRIDVRWEGRFLPALTIRGNQAESVEHELPAPFLTDAVRVVLLGAARRPATGISEVGLQAMRYNPADPTSLQDAGLTDGRYRYAVSAVDRYGAVGQSGGAEVAVGDVEPPAPPLNLTAIVVGSDVRLNWVGGDPGDTDHYVLKRDGAVIAQSAASSPTHLDVAPLNGLHEYVVHAVDAVGNRSVDSNTALATIQEPLLAAPVLAGGPGPLGESALSWTHDGAPAYELRRAFSESGPFTPIRLTATLEYRDFSVPFGVTAWYVVRAIDQRGNPSPDSNVVTVTPGRSEPPAPPVILEPTDADNPINLGTSRTPVGGRAEPGASVRVFVDGRLSGIAPVESRFVQSGAIDLPPEAAGVQLSASGNVALYWGLTPDSNWTLIRKDLVTGESAHLPTGSYDSVLNGVLSPDGSRVAVFLQNAASGYEGDLWTFDAATGAMTPVEASTSVALSPSWSADSTKLAYGLRSPSYPYPVVFEVLDLATGAARAVAGQVPYSQNNDAIVSLSPSGKYLVYSGVGLSAPALRLVSVATRANSLLGPGYEPNWNATETVLTYTRPPDAANPEGLPSLVVRTLATEEDRIMGEAEGGEFDPSGRSLLFRAGYQLVSEDLATGRRQIVTSAETYSPDQYAWLADGRIAFQDYFGGGFPLFAPDDGYFTVPHVNLSLGPNAITATAVEPTSGLESEESLPISVTVVPDFFPDLSADPAGTIVYPAVPRAAQAAVASALVRNNGGHAVEGTDVLLTLRSQAGQVAAEQRLSLPAMEPLASVRVSLPFTVSTTGRYTFTALVDDRNVLFEADETNNVAAADVEVVPAEAPVSLTLSVGSPSYVENSRALLGLSLVNGGASVSGTLTTRIESVADGAVVTVLDSRPAVLGVGGRLVLPLEWQVGSAYAGLYRARSTFEDTDGGVIVEATAPISILPSTAAAARLAVERYSTPLGGLVRFEATVENTSGNAPLLGALARFTIRSSAGVVVLQTEAPLATLLPGAQWLQTLVWSQATPAGQFEARLEAIDGPETLSSSVAPFVIVPLGPGLLGRLSLASDHLLEQQEGLADATLTNAAEDPRPGTEARVEVRAAATGQVVESIPFTVDLPASGSALRPTPLAGRPAGRYVVTLVDGANQRVVDRANLRVHAVIVPPSLHAPANGARVATSHPDLSVNNAFVSDGSPLTYEFQIFAEPSLTVALPGGVGIAEGSGRTSWRVPSRLVEDHTYYWRGRASDGFSTSAWTEVASFTVDELNLPPFAPVPEQPDPGSRVATREPSMVVRNAVDPEGDALVYEFQLATDPSVDTVIASTSAVAETAPLTSWRSPITLTEGGTYYWRARAFDGASDSPWSETAAFTVDSTNESPGAPSIVSPASAATVTSLAPALVAGLAIDPENDPLVYRFQIDATPAFDSPALQTSGDVTPASDSVSWTPPSALSDDTSYFWRVAAKDAATQGPWAQSTFRVNLANDPPTAPVPLAPADGEIVTTNQPTLRLRNATDPDGDVLTYDFIVRDASQTVVAAVADVASGLMDTSMLTPVALAENGAFTWQARARDAELAGPWSAPSSFRVNRVQDPPTAPLPVSPSGAVQIDNTRPILVIDNAMSPEGLPLSYSFELYRLSSATSTLVTAAMGVAEAQPRTSWPVDQNLGDGSYSWRARAHDGVQDGPWSPSALFSVLIDAPPLAPTGLLAVGGDGRITLTWNRNAEPDVAGYRLYRSLTSGGPYTLVATVTDPAWLDAPLPNGVTQYYVVNAFDLRFESPRSTQASATPRASSLLTAQIEARPNSAPAECLINGFRPSGDRDDEHDDGHHADSHKESRDDHDDHHDGSHHHDGDGCCPTWVTFRIELPAGVSPSTISRTSVRLAGSISAEPSYDRMVDADHDGIYEREFRFAFSSLAPLLQIGANTLSVSGMSAATPFQGSFIFTVQPLSVTMKFVPVTFNKRSQGQQVQTMLTFRDGVRAEDVLLSSVRLNGVLAAERVVTSHEEKITFKFNCDATASLLSVGANVLVQVSGTIHGLPFTARDFIRVIQ